MQLKQTPFWSAMFRRSHPVFAQKPGYLSAMAHSGADGGGMPAAKSYLGCSVVLLALWAVVPALAQSNLDAGKSPAQIFADTCNACHRSPREIKRTSPGFLREHYTTGMREAAAMAAYLASVGSDARAVQQRKPPVLGAGRAPATENGRPEVASAAPSGPEAGAPSTQTANGSLKLRRPSDSVEIGVSSASAVPARQAEHAAFPTFEE
jgi:mono/diheme cytochrome c family protein